MDARFSLSLIGALILAVLVGVLAANAQPHTLAVSAPTPTPTPIATPQSNHVEIVPAPSGSAPAYFVPHTLQVKVGQSVTWDNAATQDHSAVADNGAFDSGVIAPGESFSWTPTRPGRYTYACFLHPTMQGVIIVR